MNVRVVVDTGSASSIDSLTYDLPENLADMVAVGACVLVPLGNRQVVGYVVGYDGAQPTRKIRSIISPVNSAVWLDNDLLKLAQWISTEYVCSYSRAVLAMLPSVIQCSVESFVAMRNDLPGGVSFTESETNLLGHLISSGNRVEVESLNVRSDKEATARAIRSLEHKGVISREWELVSPRGKPRLFKGVSAVEYDSVNGVICSSLTDKQASALKLIIALKRDVSLVELTKKHGIGQSAVNALLRKGLLRSVDVVFKRFPSFTRVQPSDVVLSGEQQVAVDQILAAIGEGSYSGHLLFGVTASGKTEVYLRCMEYVLSLGKSALLLLPEIALTTEIMNVVKSRLGDEVAVLHSALSAGERYDEWVRIREGEARIVLGARSAIFAPLTNIGLVIVDEEHETSYKQDTPPRYHGRDVAIKRAQQSNAVLVLGSATPSVETYYRARAGELSLITMKRRVEDRPMPHILVADLRNNYAKGTPTIFSEALLSGIEERLAKREQVILFQNRRAYSTFLLCRDCGHVMHCPNCAVSLKLHSSEHRLSCHHCDYTCSAPDLCPECQGARIGRFGVGTERVEEEARKAFPEARILRMDKDTVAQKGAHAMILNAFRRGDADILVGTQMIAKGLDFPNVTLVGIISADTSLNMPDFRAAERTFQLVSQVSGRSGRGVRAGEVVVQTFDPDSYAVACAVKHDYETFYRTEIVARGELGYPPFGSIVTFLAQDPSEREAMSRLEELRRRLLVTAHNTRIDVSIMGPVPSLITKLRGEYRWRLILKSANREGLLGLVRSAISESRGGRRGVSVDVDPVSVV